MDIDATREYRKILDYCQGHEVPEYMLQQTIAWNEGLWKSYLNLLRRVGERFEGKVVVDFGCKYGHLLPLLIILGVSKAIGIDVEESYIEVGRKVFEKLYPEVRILRSECGFIPLQPETVDLVLVNEVISHINPGYLETLYSEIARILKYKGLVLVSDGNNAGNKRRREKLISLYEAWEKGTDGFKVDRDTMVESYITRRKKIIQTKYPNLDLHKVDYLAQNTSGLFGDFLLQVIEEYMRTGDVICRPYRQGVYPTNPDHSGVVMERAFNPIQVEMSLSSYGLVSRQIFPKPTFSRSGIISTIKDILLLVRYLIENLLDPTWRRTQSEGFQIIGVKK